ncbi:Omega-amidase YafV [subsurface metagenome]
MSEMLKLILIQFDIEWHAIDKNLSKIQKILDKVEWPVDIIVLPEMFATGFTMQPELFSEDEHKSVHKWLTNLAEKFKCAVIGSHPDKMNGRFFNRLHFFSPEGVHQYYDKRHLFTMGDEHKHYTYGSERRIIEYKSWNILPLICYDLRFPVWSRNNNAKYDLLIYIANWPAARNSAWEVLLRARAIENQCFVVGVNRTGKDGRGIQYCGNSQVVSPKGEVLHKINSREVVFTSNLDLSEVRNYRKSFPVLEDADEFEIK